jgi:transposase
MRNDELHPIGLYAYRTILASERLCHQLLRRIRWPTGVRCPRCGYSRIWHMSEAGRPEYRCRRCRFHFSETTGTIFAKTRTPLSKWILAIGLFKIGIAARPLRVELGVTYKTAWTMLDRLRQAVAAEPLMRRLSGEVEIDDTYYGGHRKGKRGRGAAGKTPVLGIRQRGGRVRSLVVPRLDAQTVQAVIRQHVRRGSRVYTDELNVYEGLRTLGYRHATVHHSAQFVASHRVHTQGIESHWAHTKPVLRTRYRKLSPLSLPKYLAEANFKRNAIHEPDFIQLVLKRLVNHTL